MPSSVNGMPRTPTVSEAASMKVHQYLASGTTVATGLPHQRPLSDLRDWLRRMAVRDERRDTVSGHVSRRVFGMTCRHVLDGFDWQRLRVTEAKFGRMFAPIRGLPIRVPRRARGSTSIFLTLP